MQIRTLPWQLASIFVLIIYSFMSLICDRTGRIGIEPQSLLFVMFLVSAFVFAARVRRRELRYVTPGVLYCFIAIGLCSWCGNVLQVRAIVGAPNPGIGVAVVGAQSLVTAVLATAFLRTTLGTWNFLGIVATLAGVGMMAGVSNADHIVDRHWLWCGIGSMIFLGINGYFFKLLSQREVPNHLIIAGMFISGTLYYAGDIIVQHIPVPLSIEAMGLYLGGILVCITANPLQIHAIKTAPNPGYAMAIIGCQSVPVAVFSTIFLGRSLSGNAASGIFVILLGIALINRVPPKKIAIEEL